MIKNEDVFFLIFFFLTLFKHFFIQRLLAQNSFKIFAFCSVRGVFCIRRSFATMALLTAVRYLFVLVYNENNNSIKALEKNLKKRQKFRGTCLGVISLEFARDGVKHNLTLMILIGNLQRNKYK